MNCIKKATGYYMAIYGRMMLFKCPGIWSSTLGTLAMGVYTRRASNPRRCKETLERLLRNRAKLVKISQIYDIPPSQKHLSRFNRLLRHPVRLLFPLGFFCIPTSTFRGILIHYTFFTIGDLSLQSYSSFPNGN